MSVEARATKDGGAAVCVRDTGLGMSSEEIAVALTPFAQVDASRSRWREGTGLGLPIAKALVQLHGGQLEIRSAKSLGTEVTVMLPSRFAGVGRARPGEPGRAAGNATPIAYAGTRDHDILRAAAGNPCRNSSTLSIGRIVSVTGAKAIVLLDGGMASSEKRGQGPAERPEMGTLFAIETTNTVVLAIVSALSVPVPAQREGEGELWIAELGLVGELWKGAGGRAATFNRGVSVYPTLGDRVRVASRPELEQAFCGDKRNSVRVGCIRQDPSISAIIRVDDLLGKHFAILGTTGTGKSCTTALILRSILQKNPAAHIVLLDPHNEYAPAFGEWAEVISQRNMQLPYWLLTFEELVEVLIGDPQERKAEVEILQELIPIAKARYGTGRGNAREAGLRRAAADAKYTVDTPVPYRISDLIQIIDERMGKLENKRDLSPYRNLKTRLEIICTTRAMPSCSARSRSTTTWRRSSAASSACPSTTSRSPSWSSPACRPRSSTSSSPCSAA